MRIIFSVLLLSALAFAQTKPENYSILIHPNGDISTGVSFFPDPGGVTLLGAAEASLVLEGGTCHMWYTSNYGGPEMWYNTADNEGCTNWGAGQSVLSVPGGLNYPSVFTYQSVYYALVLHDADQNIHLWRSADKITWTHLNNGNPVLVHAVDPNHWGNALFNPSAAVDSKGTIHFMVEAGCTGCVQYMGYATTTFSELNFNKNIIPVMKRAGQPDLKYLPSKNALLPIYGDQNDFNDYWQIRAATASLSDNLFNPANWHKSPNFIFAQANHNVTDPFLLDTAGTKLSTLRLTYYFDQITENNMYTAWSGLSLDDFYDRLADPDTRVWLPIVSLLGSLDSPLRLSPSSYLRTSLNFPDGPSGPDTPVNGDMWSVNGDLIHYHNGSNMIYEVPLPTEETLDVAKGSVMIRDGFSANPGTNNGIYFRSGFGKSSKSKYNLSIMADNLGFNRDGGLSINAYDGIRFVVGSQDASGEFVSFDPSGHLYVRRSTPTIACGVSASVSGNDVVGRITVAGGQPVTTCTLKFSSPWASSPVCMVNDESSSPDFIGASPTSTSLQFTSAKISGKTFSYHCIGYK